MSVDGAGWHEACLLGYAYRFSTKQMKGKKANGPLRAQRGAVVSLVTCILLVQIEGARSPLNIDFIW